MQLKKQKEELKEKKKQKKSLINYKTMNKLNRQKNIKMLSTRFLEVIIKIDKDNNVEQALRVLKRKLQRDGFFKIIKLKNTYEKPSEKKKRILQENI